MMTWEKLLSPHRIGSSTPGIITPERSPFQRDFDRIVFSSSFRRLQDKTQVFPLAKNDFVHTRLTHSIEASSIARSLGTAAGVHICQEFPAGMIHPSDIGAVIAAAALAHDIGNPPLGHAGEEAIRHWFTRSEVGKAMGEQMSQVEALDIANFDGNAQGFRILSRLEMPDRAGGMQLTCATLGCFAKYPYAAGCGPKKCGFFRQDLSFFKEVADHCGLVSKGDNAWCRHPLSFLLEAADDIAYLTVDFEDGQRLGMIDYSVLEMFFLDIIDSPHSVAYVKTLKSSIRKAEFLRAQVIGVLVRKTVKVFIDTLPELLRGERIKPLIDDLDCIEILNKIRAQSSRDIYYHRNISEIIGAGFELVLGMLDVFVPCVNEIAVEKSIGIPASDRSHRISAMLPTLVESEMEWVYSPYQRMLRILDYISGMTDHYAVSLYQKLKGISL